MPDVPEANQGHEADRLAPGHPVAAPPGIHRAGPETPAAVPPAGKPPPAAGKRSGWKRPGMPWVLLAPGHGDYQPGSLAVRREGKPNGLTYPKVVRKSGLLRSDERPILLVRKHPAALTGYVFIALLVLLAAVVVGQTVGTNGTKFSITLFHHVYKVNRNYDTAVITGIWLVYLLVFLYALYQIAAWSVSFFIITDRQMILVAGLLVPRLASVPTSKVTSWYLRESFRGPIFGYKSLVFKSGDNDQVVRTIGYVPLDAVEGIRQALSSIPREAGDAEAFKKWTAEGRGLRRVRLIIAVLLICLLVVLAVLAANVPSIRTQLGNEKEIIALIPILIVLITPKK